MQPKFKKTFKNTARIENFLYLDTKKDFLFADVFGTFVFDPVNTTDGNMSNVLFKCHKNNQVTIIINEGAYNNIKIQNQVLPRIPGEKRCKM